jgi:hypothetical protein
MGDAPQSIERRLILPTLDNMSFGDLRYIADSIDEYAERSRRCWNRSAKSASRN